VKPLATIELDPGTPDRTRAILAAISRLAVKRGRRLAITAAGTTHPLAIMQGIHPYAHVTAPLLAELTRPGGRVPLVVAERLARHVRDALEEAGCSYADGTGAVHIDLPGFLLHIEGRTRSEGSLTPPRGLGAVGVRVIQTVLAEPARNWTITDLANVSGSSTGEAHKVLQRLEDEGLVEANGSGRARRRRVLQPADLLDWLARVPVARKIHGRLTTYLYAPEPDALITRLAFNATRQDQLQWALTGAAAARVMGVTAVTALPSAMVRVPSKPGLKEAAATLGLDPVASGGNVLLVADVGDVGIRGAMRNGPVPVAPPVRIWLDMLGEPRGEDAAALFREAALAF
jgi:hypothetical protein